MPHGNMRGTCNRFVVGSIPTPGAELKILEGHKDSVSTKGHPLKWIKTFSHSAECENVVNTSERHKRGASLDTNHFFCYISSLFISIARRNDPERLDSFCVHCVTSKNTGSLIFLW